MGGCESKEQVEFADIDNEVPVYDTKLISFDENGNLVYGFAECDRNQELALMMNIETRSSKEQEEWYIVDAIWISLWLLYCRDPTLVQPRPPPCFNHRLIYWDGKARAWVAKPNLKLEVKNVDNRAGDYRRVSKETWYLIKQLYPGSGPKITSTLQIDFKSSSEEGKDAKADDTKVKNGKYPCNDWVIEDIVDGFQDPIYPEGKRTVMQILLMDKEEKKEQRLTKEESMKEEEKEDVQEEEEEEEIVVVEEEEESPEKEINVDTEVMNPVAVAEEDEIVREEGEERVLYEEKEVIEEEEDEIFVEVAQVEVEAPLLSETDTKEASSTRISTTPSEPNQASPSRANTLSKEEALL